MPLLACAVLGVLAAVVVAGGLGTGASTADTPDIYTATTLTQDTATTLTSDTSTTIDSYQSRQIAFYRATIIKKLPPAAPIKRIAGRGGGFSLPANCNAACSLAAWIITDNVAGWLLDAKSRTLGHATAASAGGGAVTLKVALARRWRKAALHSRKPLRVKIRELVTDTRDGFRKQRVQTVTLKP